MDPKTAKSGQNPEKPQKGPFLTVFGQNKEIDLRFSFFPKKEEGDLCALFLEKNGKKEEGDLCARVFGKPGKSMGSPPWFGLEVNTLSPPFLAKMGVLAKTLKTRKSGKWPILGQK